jgi:glycosyltransferase involved in cell wall biosynthesis
LRESSAQNPVSILAVIVLYRTHAADSPAFQTLLAAKANLDSAQTRLQILLHDNTPELLDPGPLPDDVRYEAAGRNAGLASAYNRALSIAQQDDCTWLLILDQDTTLPTDFLSRISQVAAKVEPDPGIAAIVPRMLDHGRPVAPVFMRFWGPSYAAAECQGTSAREVHATNSATLFRVSSLKQIGGFSPYFWLDYLDGYVFHQIFALGGKIYIAREIEVVHELSLLHGGDLTPERFHNILRAESAYWDLYGTPVQRLAFDARLLLRTQRQKSRGHTAAITQLTWNELKRRVFHSKAHRIQEWKCEMELQISNSSASVNDTLQDVPSISVCMAAYNGERYIKAQLQSILPQLRATDEVIIVDDTSSDRTRQVIASLQDQRIRLIQNDKNQGVLRTFEEAIRAASGDILFLSDQDDLWAPDKVPWTLRIFQLHPNANVVVSDAALISEQGVSIAPSYYAQLGGFRSGVLQNLIHCRYLGCTMAFRSRIRKEILPFPAGHPVLHDLWIGALNAFLGGETIYIDRPLVHYRRHPRNVTGNQRLPLARQLQIRWGLFASLITVWFRRHFGSGSNQLSSRR